MQSEIGSAFSVGGNRNGPHEIYVQFKEVTIAKSIIHSQ